MTSLPAQRKTVNSTDGSTVGAPSSGITNKSKDMQSSFRRLTQDRQQWKQRTLAKVGLFASAVLVFVAMNEYGNDLLSSSIGATSASISISTPGGKGISNLSKGNPNGCESQYNVKTDTCRYIQCISYRRSWNAVPEQLQSHWYDKDCRSQLRKKLEPLPAEKDCPSFQPKGKEVQISHQRLHAIRDKYKGESCVLIGNGPSLNKMKWDWQENFKVIMGLNKIYLGLERYNLTRINVYSAINTLVVEQSVEEIWGGLTHGDSGIRPADIEKFMLIQENSPKRFPCSSTKDRKFHWLHQANQIKDLFSQDPTGKGFHTGRTVTYWSLQALYWIGCSKVFLIGVDHTFNQTGKPNEKHYMNKPDPNHFDPAYFQGNYWHNADIDYSDHYYKIANKTYWGSGREIYDATEGGLCQVFPKVDWRKALYPNRKR